MGARSIDRISVTSSIVTYRSDPELLRRLVESLLVAIEKAREVFDLRTEIIFVINDDRPGETEQVCGLAGICAGRPNDCFSIIRGHGNVGYGTGQNKALDRLASDYHLILNPDVVVDEMAILESILYLDSHEEAVMVTPQGYDPADNYAHLSKRHPTVLALMLRWFAVQASDSTFCGRCIARYTYADELPAEQPFEVFLASGCFMFCRTEAFRAVRGFNEAYFLYFEDYDLSLRLAEYGGIVEIPNARITHYGGRTGRRGVRRALYFVRSGWRFFNQHGWSVY